MKSTKYGIFLLSLIFVISSCVKKLDIIVDPNEGNNASNLTEITVTDDFDWKTSSKVSVSIQTLDNTGAPIPNIKVSLFSDYEAFGNQNIINGFTNSNGLYELDYVFASATDSIVIDTDYLGFIKEIKVPIVDGNIYYIFGGIPIPHEEETDSLVNKSSLDTEIDLETLGKWYKDGTPRYLEDEGDNITVDFLTEINNALPEYQAVPSYHPEYLLENNDQNIYLDEKAKVWVTFVSEGADYLNTLAFYTFDKKDPPKKIDDIDEATIIFPNASFKNSGGGLNSGDKVKIGKFSKGTSIGWLLISDGYDTESKEVTDGENYLFSHKNLNPESNPDYQQHIVLLKDANRDIFLLSFEDLKRPDGDADFNDAIFYVTIDPVSAVDDSNIPALGAVVDNDSDDDGVEDNFDEYPEDPDAAFNNYYPSKGNYATLAFEDLWPSKGDYDFNDLIVDYNFNTITNADNDVVKLKGEFVVRAIGAGFHNGFGFEIENILSTQVSSLTGSALEEGYILLNANGTEAGQTNATVIVFDDAWNHGYGNTDPSKTYTESTEVIQIELTLSTPVSFSQFGLAPFNPFIIVNKERGREIHMANYKPTDLADYTYFGQYNDDTNLATGKYYKTQDNLPWVINIPQKFYYPIEKSSIDKAHLNFIPWVESSGSLFNDWYFDSPGYRNSDFLY